MSDINPWKIISSELKYDNKWNYGIFCKGVPGNCILYIIFQGPELMNTKMCNKK